MGVFDLHTTLLFSVIVHFCVLLMFWKGLPEKRAAHLDEELTRVEVVSSRRNPKIVQSAPAKITDQKDPHAFLAAKNQKTDRETVSRTRMTVMGTAQSTSHVRSKSQLSHLGLKILPSQPKMDTDTPRWATPGTRPQDFIQGMKEGDATVLNTQEYMFYGYFQRIRERLDRAWVPILREKLTRHSRTGRQLASDFDHVTQVMVVLNERGEIVRVKLLNESGVRELDEAAVAAFNQAGPFPNPPKGIVDKNKEVQIPWDFILKT